MKKVAAAALSCIASFSYAAGWSDSINQIPMEDCNIRTVGMTVSFHNVKRQGDLSGEALKTLSVMEKATSNAKAPGVAVEDQMSSAEKDAFATARQHKLAIDGIQLIESDYARDMKAILSLVQVADSNYRYDTQVKETDPNYVYQAVLGLMHLALASQETTAPKLSRICTTEIALHSVEDESLRRFDTLKLPEVYKSLQAILDKYHLEKYDRSKVSDVDAEQYYSIMQKSIYPAQREQKFFREIEYIKLIAKIDELVYEASKKDMMDSGGNFMSVGTTLRKMVKDKKIDDSLAIAYSMREMIATKVPSEMLTQMQTSTKQMAEIIKNNPVTKKK